MLTFDLDTLSLRRSDPQHHAAPAVPPDRRSPAYQLPYVRAEGSHYDYHGFRPALRGRPPDGARRKAVSQLRLDRLRLPGRAYGRHDPFVPVDMREALAAIRGSHRQRRSAGQGMGLFAAAGPEPGAVSAAGRGGAGASYR